LNGGHLVLATLHTNDAAQAIDRMLDVFPAGLQQQAWIQLAACLSGVVFQQLLPALGGRRLAAFEVLVVNQAIRSHIKGQKNNQVRNAIQTSLHQVPQTLEWSLSQLIHDGPVSVEEAQGQSRYPREISA
jgi:twitching motility protein PilT